MKLFEKQNGMNIIGQGGKIILFMLPALAAAICLQILMPNIAALPKSIDWVRYIGYALLLGGVILWGSAIVQLLMGFPKGKLVTSGAYGVVRNPIYSSVTFFLLPAITLITMTWVYLVPAIFLYWGVRIFIGKEETHLTETFGQMYVDYTHRVDRLVPFKKPRR